jgi:hypothetical protein
MITAIATEKIAMVLYWRFKKAQAPLKIISPISFILGVPMGRFSTFLASSMAKMRVITPAAGTTQKMPGIFPPSIDNSQNYTTPIKTGQKHCTCSMFINLTPLILEPYPLYPPAFAEAATRRQASPWQGEGDDFF